jgi:hypothetical protein
MHPVTLIAERGAPKQAGSTTRQIGHQDGVIPMCPTVVPKGAWGEYREKDLPSGPCSAPPACVLWTKELCPGTEYPGPAIKWKCVCTSGMWRCDELERSKTACIEPHHSRRLIRPWLPPANLAPAARSRAALTLERQVTPARRNSGTAGNAVLGPLLPFHASVPLLAKGGEEISSNCCRRERRDHFQEAPS